MVSIITLDQPITARSFRIEPMEHETLKVVRTELFGCPYKIESIQEKLGMYVCSVTAEKVVGTKKIQSK